MASRKEQKEAARARRLAEEQAQRERERRRRRLQMVAGVALLAVVVIAVAVVASSSGGGSSGLQQGTKRNQTISAVETMFAGIPQSGTTLGNPNAPVTMIYYGDLECPICKDFTLQGGFPQLVAKDVKSGRVKVEYRAFQTATRDPSTFQTQQVAALAAGQQNRFWDFTELFYREQGAEGTPYVTDSYLSGLARQVPGLNMSRWQSARSSATLAAQVHNDEQMGASSGVQGTPTLIFEGPKGKTNTGAAVPNYGQLEQAVKAVS